MDSPPTSANEYLARDTATATWYPPTDPPSCHDSSNKAFLLVKHNNLPQDDNTEPTASTPRRHGQPRDPNPFRHLRPEPVPVGQDASLRLGDAEPQKIGPGVWDAHNAGVTVGVGNVRYAENPARNALASIVMAMGDHLPAEPLGDEYDVNVDDEEELTRLCMEPTPDDPRHRCPNTASKSSVCHNPAHTHRGADGRYIVCSECDITSAGALVASPGGPLTAASLFAMRAYMCTPCAATTARSVASCGALPTDSSSKVWGVSANHAVPARLGPVLTSYPGVALPATGCACASKLVGVRLCDTHRQRALRQAGEQTALMREWQMRAEVGGLCPACLFRRGREGARESADVDGFRGTREGGPTGWLCLACNDWVVNQPNGPDGKPQLVPGRLRDVDVSELF